MDLNSWSSLTLSCSLLQLFFMSVVSLFLSISTNGTPLFSETHHVHSLSFSFISISPLDVHWLLFSPAFTLYFIFLDPIQILLWVFSFLLLLHLTSVLLVLLFVLVFFFCNICAPSQFFFFIPSCLFPVRSSPLPENLYIVCLCCSQVFSV